MGQVGKAYYAQEASKTFVDIPPGKFDGIVRKDDSRPIKSAMKNRGGSLIHSLRWDTPIWQSVPRSNLLCAQVFNFHAARRDIVVKNVIFLHEGKRLTIASSAAAQQEYGLPATSDRRDLRPR